MAYGFNGQTFENVIAATYSGARDVQETSAPGVDGVNVFDLGDRGETYSLTLFEYTLADDVDATIESIIKSMNEQGDHNLVWHGRTFKAQFLRHTVGPYSRSSHARRVEVVLEFRKSAI